MRGARGRKAGSVAAVLVAVSFGLGGCGGGDATIVTDDGTVVIDQDDDGGSITIDSSEGSMTITGESGGELPEGWPTQVAVPDGGSVDASGTFSGGDGAAWQASITYPDMTAKDVVAEMKASMEDAGFKVEAEFTVGDQSAVTFSGEGLNVTATASEQDSGAVLVVVIASVR